MIAVVVCSILLLGTITGLVVVLRWPEQRPEPRHAGLPVRATGRFADPQDATDPDGEKYLVQLGAAEQDRARNSQMPSGRGPADVLDELPDIPTPPAPSWAGRREPDIDVTQSIPHAVGTWGKTAATLVGQLADEHLAVKS